MSDRFDALDVALGEVAPEARSAAEARLASDAAFAAEVARLREVARRLEGQEPETWRPEPPPPLRLPAPPRRRLRARLAWRPLRVAAAGAVAAAAAALVGVAVLGGDDGRPVTLAALPEARAGASGEARVSDERVRLEVRLAPSREGEFYELWLLNSPEDLVSVGTFRVDEEGRAEAEFALGVDPERFAALDVSVEPLDGDPGHSSRSVLRSRALG